MRRPPGDTARATRRAWPPPPTVPSTKIWPGSGLSRARTSSGMTGTCCKSTMVFLLQAEPFQVFRDIFEGRLGLLHVSLPHFFGPNFHPIGDSDDDHF